MIQNLVCIYKVCSYTNKTECFCYKNGCAMQVAKCLVVKFYQLKMPWALPKNIMFSLWIWFSICEMEGLQNVLKKISSSFASKA